MSVISICSREECGKGYVSKRKVDYGFCPDCRKFMKKLRMERWRKKMKKIPVDLSKAIERKVVSLTVVSDPLEDGGFQPSVTFDKQGWQQMYRHLSFTPGTLLKDGRGRLYEFRSAGVK